MKMSVHKAISEHSKSQNKRIGDFLRLEKLREELIEDAVSKCKNKLPYGVEKINIITKEMNQLAREGIVPQRKTVTTEMVEEYVNKLNSD
jgi:hypothetical protein